MSQIKKLKHNGEPNSEIVQTLFCNCNDILIYFNVCVCLSVYYRTTEGSLQVLFLPALRGPCRTDSILVETSSFIYVPVPLQHSCFTTCMHARSVKSGDYIKSLQRAQILHQKRPIQFQFSLLHVDCTE